MILIAVLIPIFLISVTPATESASSVLSSSNNRNPNSVDSFVNYRQQPHEEAELMEDGRDIRILTTANQDDPWEGRRDIDSPARSGAAATGVSRREKMEAFGAFVCALVTAISANLFSRYAIHELSELTK